MPKREKDTTIRHRHAYRPDAAASLARIDAKRLRLGLTLADLATRAGISERTLTNMRRDGRAWPRHVRALTFALRTIERERDTEEKVLT